MAVKQMLTVDDDQRAWFNLSYAVGQPGANRKDDVMLVQALFNFVAIRSRGDTSRLGIGRNQIPDVTGQIDGTTILAIQRFQLRWAQRIFKIESVMHPAKYDGGNVEIIGRRVEPITLLMSIAQAAEPLNFTSSILVDFPALRRFAALGMVLVLK